MIQATQYNPFTAPPRFAKLRPGPRLLRLRLLLLLVGLRLVFHNGKASATNLTAKTMYLIIGEVNQGDNKKIQCIGCRTSTSR